MNKRIFVLSLFLIAGMSFAGENFQITFSQPQSQIYQLEFDLLNFQFGDVTHDGVTYSQIHFGSGVTTENKGYAEIPYLSVSVQLPANKNVDLAVTVEEYEETEINNALLPSRGVIYRNQDPDSIPFEIDPASLTDSWYPGDPALISRPFIIRNVRGTSIRIYPFQYNAARNVVRIYNKLRIELVENDAVPDNPFSGQAGGMLRGMDKLYRSVFINFAPEQTSNQRDALTIAQAGEILVIATARDEEAIEPLIQWKREKGFVVHKEIAATGSNVKNLIQQKYNENPNILFVQLVGDWADLKSDLGTSENAPMDPKLGCVAGDDNFMDLCIGRISAGSPEQVTTQVNKIIAYEQNPESGGDWYAYATGIASDEGAGDDNEYDYAHLDVIWNDKLDPFTYDNYTAVYEPSATKTMISNAVNSGTGIINYTGHGSSTSWGTTGFNNTDVSNLTNGGRLPFIFAVACLNGAFHNSSDCFAETWLKNENGGAVAMLASTINQPWDPPMRGQDYFNDVLIGGYDYDAHTGQNGINTTEQRTTFGSIIFNGLTLMLTESETSSDIETVQTWSVFGDPSMEIRTANPEVMTLTNDVVMQGVPFITSVSDGEAVPEAWVTLSQDGRYFTGISAVDGSVTVEHTLLPGPAKMVVTAFNTRTIYQDIVVVSSEGPYVVIDSCEVNDAETGNGNFLADFDELIDLDIFAQNIGSDSAFNVSVKLASTDTFITISDSIHRIGDLDSAATFYGEKAFRLQIADNIPDQYAASLEFIISDDSSNIWTSQWSLVVNAPKLQIGAILVDDSATGNDDGKLDAGETADVLILTVNSGHAFAADPVSELTSESPYLTLNSTTFLMDTLYANDSVYAVFNITAAPGVPLGTVAGLKNHVQSTQYSALDSFNLVVGDIPVYNMHDNTVTCNHGLFFDSGGEQGPYSLRERLTLTFLPEENSPALQAIFSAFEVESNDELHVYDGASKNAPEFPGSPFTGSNIPATITATNPQGALTFYFTSNLRDNANGWKAEIITDAVSDIAARSDQPVEQFKLYPNFPNPFNPSTTIQYQLPVESEVKIRIYNMLGQAVRELSAGLQKQGAYQLKWDGKDDHGNAQATGIYLLRMDAGQFVSTRKLLLLK